MTLMVSADLLAPFAAHLSGDALAQFQRLTGPRFVLIGADGRELPADYAGNDHVAIHEPSRNLTWSREVLGLSSQKAAAASCKKLRLLGLKDWRLPDVEELAPLLAYNLDGTKLDPRAFPNAERGGHWTRSAVPGDPGCFRVVGFDYGSVYSFHGDYFRFFARPVRVGGLPAGQ